MKKKFFAIALCAVFVLAMAIPAFAAKPASDIKNYSLSDGIQPSSTSRFTFTDGIRPSSTYSFTFQFELEGTGLYLNVNNAAHPGTAGNGDAVIVWNEVNTRDQQWYVVGSSDGPGNFLRTALNYDYGMNIDHVTNKCNLIQHPQVNYYQGKNDSAIFPPWKTNIAGAMVLAEWPYALTNSVAKAGYTSYWTSSGSNYLAS